MLPTTDLLTSGTVTLTVTLSPTFVLARTLLGDAFHPSYTYRIERVVNADKSVVYFLSTLTDGGKRGPSFVYTGVLNPVKGTIRLTAKSAFPATATRYRVADRCLQAIFAGRGDDITKAGWSVSATVEKEAAGRF